MKINSEIDLLKQIKHVDAPPFLFTRIKQSIDGMTYMEAPKQWKWALGLSVGIVLVLNLSVLLQAEKMALKLRKSNTQLIVQSMNLITNNTLYNE